MILNIESDVMIKYSGISTVTDEERISSIKHNNKELIYVTEDDSEFARKIQNDGIYYEKLRLIPGFARQEFKVYNINRSNS